MRVTGPRERHGHRSGEYIPEKRGGERDIRALRSRPDDDDDIVVAAAAAAGRAVGAHYGRKLLSPSLALSV